MKRTFSIKTLGCKLNQYESALIARQFADCGWESRPFGEPVDVVVINTCTVTDRSDKKCRNYIRQGARFSRLGKAVVTGCMVERDRKETALMDEVLAVFGNDDKRAIVRKITALVEYAEDLRETDERDDDQDAAFMAHSGGWDGDDCFDEAAVEPLYRSRAYLRVQDGCDGACSYCIVPSVRGAPRSRAFAEVIDHARRLTATGCPELVLTGITIGRYDDCGADLAALVEAVAAIPGEFRVRVTSIEPTHVTDRLIGLLGSPKVCGHIHLPLQSGSDRILAAMNRPYTLEGYMKVVDRIRAHDPDIAIGTDIIVGFPGETDEDFAGSVDALVHAEFAYVHQFSFSPRTGTPAASGVFCGERAITRRSSILRRSAAETGRGYRRRFEGALLQCVVERRKNGAGHMAVSDNYIRIKLSESAENEAREGTIAPVRLARAGYDETTGSIEPQAHCTNYVASKKRESF
ncbi:MAG: tRNA (N(6)-L-threonylcarbamoyladenosine(37)-C(2))-methylthiotransferase MtaB [Spirochaetes bacterium]|jgi:threonylcarbamoyladenosine tRNA methylthiotransferase MtaB|nr:tRNA (N(6)-L-threonylcarbamoyladenosine(37)-C(2))-methylthiotransferase MtaB [Spirochaetota bacterium]